MTSYIIPLIFLTVIVLSSVKRKNTYALFVEGGKNALSLIAEVFPYLLTVMMAVELLRQSGVSSVVATIFSPLTKAVGIPPALTELILIRPLSGAGAMGVLDGIFASYGTDTLIGNCASIIYGSSETVFYISAVYFSKSSVKSLRYAIPLSLLCTYLGCIVGCFFMRIW